MNKKDRIKNSNKLGRELRDCGIYAINDSPSKEDGIFTIRLEESSGGKRKKLYYEMGGIDPNSIKVYKNKKLRQAVVSINEKARQYVVEVTLDQVREKNPIWEIDNLRLLDYMYRFDMYDLYDFIDVRFPVESEDIANSKEKLDGDRGYKYTLDIPETDNCFLVGYDEDDLFICLLPSQVKSVSEAHKVLRPEGVPENAARQGEFYFVKPSGEDYQKMAKKIRAVHYDSGCSIDASDHYASHMSPCGKYVTGWITHSRHKPLFLDGWYEVVRNTELEPGTTDWD